ncbi:MAG: hypothetical protein VSS75_020030 [Candidatus Parabeggiatoa sp.]|nr:hypothetical protein [Candidatus Parabeggiatoa sp.]
MEKLENKVYDYLSVLKGHVETMGGTFQFRIEFPDEGYCDNFVFLKKQREKNSSNENNSAEKQDKSES